MIRVNYPAAENRLLQKMFKNIKLLCIFGLFWAKHNTQFYILS